MKNNSKLYFRFGAMGSSKTANALMMDYNFLEKGKKVLLLKSEVDTRDGLTKIKSRIGLEKECFLLKNILLDELHKELTDIVNNKDKKRLKKFKNEHFDYDFIIIDEAQFATKSQILFISDIVDFLNISVYCYGLRTDFKNELFEGSQYLLAMADEIEQIPTMCWCGKKAICNARYNEMGIVKDGEQIMLGGNSNYIALCRKHYKTGKTQKH